MSMTFAFFVSASLAAGLVLHDGGSMPEVDLRKALRMRQYVLLNPPEEGNSTPISLLATGFRDKESISSLLGESAETIAQTASLDDIGFGSVAATKSTAAMATFVRRLLDSQGLRVKDEAFMFGVLPYYTGECADQSFSALTQELNRAKKSRSCHPAWIVKKNRKGFHTDRKYMQPHTAKDTERAAVLLVKGIMSELGATVAQGDKPFAHMWQFANKLLMQNKTIKDLQQQLQNKRLQKWMKIGTPAHHTFALKGPISSKLHKLGKAAPFNEDGYRAVVYARDDDEMSSFIRRVAKHEGLKVVNEGALAGMTPYYSGLCARQSYDALVRELHSLVGKTFSMKFDLEVSSESAPNVGDLKAMIAKRAGVDVDQITIEDAEIKRRQRRLHHHRKKGKHQPAPTAEMEQKGDETGNPPTMVASHESPPSIVPGVAHKSKKRKGFTVTIAIDSAPKVHNIKKALKKSAFVEGQTKLTLPEASEVEASKPPQCGGGLLMPK